MDWICRGEESDDASIVERPDWSGEIPKSLLPRADDIPVSKLYERSVNKIIDDLRQSTPENLSELTDIGLPEAEP